MDNYKKTNIEKTEELIKENIKNGMNLGRFKRHENIAVLVDKYIDKNAKILEIGVREGFLFDHLKKKGFKDFYGIDISPLGIKILNKNGYKGHVADAQEDFEMVDRKFNAVIISHCLEHIPNTSKVIQNIYNCLEENGILYVEVPKQPKEPIPTAWGHYYCFVDIAELKSFFSQDKWKLLYQHEKINKNKERGNIRCIYIKI